MVVRPNQARGSREPELFPGQVEVPACFHPGAVLDLGRLDAPHVRREGQPVRVAKEAAKNDGSDGWPARFPHGRQLDETNLGRLPVPVQGQIE